MNICWNEEKNILLQNTRHVSFQQVEKEILLGNYTIMPNKNYPHQEIFVVPLKGYPYCVPFVQEKNTIFGKQYIQTGSLNNLFLTRGKHFHIEKAKNIKGKNICMK